MKKLIYFFGLIIAGTIVFNGCQNLIHDNELDQMIQSETYHKTVAEDGSCTFPMLAGQDIDIGTVTLTWVTNSSVEVVYEITDPLYCMYEIHLDLQADPDNFPHTKKGNPKVGLFAYGDDELDCVDTWPSGEINLFDADIGWGYGMPVFVAAHAAVIKNGTQPILYATEYISGANPVKERILGIYTDATSAEVLYKEIPWTNAFYTQNGNAYENGYFYFSIFGNYPTPLYFNDMNGTQEPVLAGTLTGKSTGAAFYNGIYYYMDHETDDFRKVTFNPDGTIESDVFIASILEDTEFAGQILKPGDIAISADEVVYGSVTRSGAGVFFKMNLDGSGYEELITGEVPFGTSALQIAFGGDGVLYGVDFTSKIMYRVNTDDGETEVIGNVGKKFGDLAGGEMWDYESAWAGDLEFPGNNWATYFSCCISPQIINGSFEDPQISQGTWKWFPSNNVPGWTVEWHDSNNFGCTPSAPANLEFHNNLWPHTPAADGNQYVEMDSHASGCGSKANVRIFQEIQTCDSEEYTLSFAWRPRIQSGTCNLKVFWGADELTLSDYTSDWQIETFTVLGNGLVTLSFVETGTPDQLGTFLDNVTIK